jgi:hypothetical protein
VEGFINAVMSLRAAKNAWTMLPGVSFNWSIAFSYLPFISVSLRNVCFLSRQWTSQRKLSNNFALFYVLRMPSAHSYLQRSVLNVAACGSRRRRHKAVLCVCVGGGGLELFVT